MRKLFSILAGTVIALLLSSNSVFANEKAYVNCDLLNVRVSPNTDCEIVTQIYNRTPVEIIYTEPGWYNVQLSNGTTGFVSAPYLTLGELPVLPASETGNKIAEMVQNYIGYSYVYGAAGPSAFDCSGLTSYIYKQFGYSIPRTADIQATVGTYIDKASLQPGDLVFFSNRSNRSINHVGIYIGNNNFVHASTSIRGVVTDNLTSNYYTKSYVTARRII